MTSSFLFHNQTRRARTNPLRLELLEDRTLPDVKAAILHDPQAITAAAFLHATAAPLPHPDATSPTVVSPSGSGSGQGLPPPPPPTNVLVDDPNASGTSAQDTHSETSVMVVGNTVVVGYNDSSRYSGSSQHFTGYAISSDGGQTFTDRGALPATPNGDAGDPVLAHDNVSGRSYFATLTFNGTLNVFRSNDNFGTFLSTTNVNRSGGSFDKEWMVVDNFAGAGQGNVYLVTRDFGSGNGIFLFKSTDGGATFGPTGGVQVASAGAVQGAWVTVGADHAVYVAWYDTGGDWIRKSTDGGATFGTAIRMTPLVTTGVNGDLGLGFRSNAFPQVIASPTNPSQLFLAYDDKGAGSKRGDVFVRVSNDGGATWGAAIRVTDGTSNNDQWQPALAVTPTGGQVGVFWYDRRNDPANNLIDRYGAIGTVAGGTVVFGANFRVSDANFPTDYGHDPVVNGIYMGDYDQAVATTNSFYTNWGDNRLASRGHTGNRSDVRDARIPFSVAGPAVIALSPSSTPVAPPVSTLRVTFDEQMDLNSIYPAQFALYNSLGNTINILSATPVAGSQNTQFDVTFTSQGTTGTYYFYVSTFVQDLAGHFMDQDGNGIPGEPTDYFFGTFSIFAPQVTASTPSGTNLVAGMVNDVRVTFNEPMNLASFTAAQVSFIQPDGTQVHINSIQPVSGTGNTQFDLMVSPLIEAGGYQLTIGPNITDMFGNQMDQDEDGFPGQANDGYSTSFAVASPIVLSYSPSGTVTGTVDHVRVMFSSSMYAPGFGPGQVTLTGPGGAVTVNSVTPVAGSNNTQFDVGFNALPVGAYTLTLSTAITDQYGNNVIDTPIRTELVSNGGFETGSFSSWTLSGNTASTSVGGNAHSGSFAANLGPVGSEGFIAQMLTTTPGVGYTLDYWLSNGGAAPNQFEAYINGAVVTGSAILNSASFAYREYTFTFTATAGTTELKFGFRQDPSFFYLDDVSFKTIASGLIDHFTVQ